MNAIAFIKITLRTKGERGWKGMMDTITIKDVARICGVGVSTVSRAINNHPDINMETKTKIMQVIKENHYIPNNSARNLKRSNSKAIVVLIKGISNPFFGNIIKTFEREIIQNKYSFILQRVDDYQDELDVALEIAKEKKPRGIVFLGGSFNHSEEKLSQINVPFVLSTVSMMKKLNNVLYSSVSVDDFKESYKIVDYLCKTGHRKIAILSALKKDASIGELRYNGYIKALEDNGIEMNPLLVCPMTEGIETYSMENGYEVTKKLLKSKEDFTALYAISDSTAIGACKAILDAGLRIPQDYSVVGFDGLDIAYYYNPSLTTIRQPMEDMAQATIRILFDVIHGKLEQQHLIFPGELVIGQSTRII